MYVVHATHKLRTRLGHPIQPGSGHVGEPSSTTLGAWYATAWFWRPHVALFVNERTLLPVLTPLAPAATLLDRFLHALADLLAAHTVPPTFIDHELAQMGHCHLTKTTNRSVVGIMNEFTHLAEAYRDPARDPDLLDLAVQLATTPCSPLYGSHTSPDRALAALTASR
jgi:hypothetical protein